MKITEAAASVVSNVATALDVYIVSVQHASRSLPLRGLSRLSAQGEWSQC